MSKTIIYVTVKDIAKHILDKCSFREGHYYETIMRHSNGEHFMMLVRVLNFEDDDRICVQKISFHTTMNGKEDFGMYKYNEPRILITKENFKRFYSYVS